MNFTQNGPIHNTALKINFRNFCSTVPFTSDNNNIYLQKIVRNTKQYLFQNILTNLQFKQYLYPIIHFELLYTRTNYIDSEIFFLLTKLPKVLLVWPGTNQNKEKLRIFKANL